MTISTMTRERSELRYMNSGRRRYAETPVGVMLRNRWEVKLVVSGSCFPIRSDRQRQPLVKARAPCLYCFEPEDEHGWLDFEGRESVIEVMHFDGVPREVEEALRRGAGQPIELGEGQAQTVLAVASFLRSHYHRPRLSTPLAVEAALGVLASVVLDRGGSGPSEAPRHFAAEKAQQALDWYRENLDRRPTVQQVARGLGLSATHLRRLFRAARRETPLQAFESIRMEEARRLLGEGRMTVAGVAESLGYSEASAFSRAYKRAMGRPPAAEIAAAGR